MKLIRRVKRTLGLLLKKLIPIKRHRVVFMSFAGHYSDNPKYISMSLHTIDPTYEIVWLVKKKYISLLPEYVRAVDIDCFWKRIWYLGSAHVIVDNVYGEKNSQKTSNGFIEACFFRLDSWLSKKRQTVYTTWHGTPLKKMGRDQHGNCVLDFSCPNTVMIHGNAYTQNIMNHLTFDKVPSCVLGSPRNDLLFTTDEDTCIEVKTRLGLPLDKKILLFAPTFRNDGPDTEGKNVRRSGLDQLESMDFERLFNALSHTFGGEWVFVCRFHYHVESLVAWDALEQKHPGRILNGNKHEDMTEYMLCSDLLLTDASSCMFDFIHTKKPCFLLFPDVEHYQNVERGFYLSVSSLPFPLATDAEQLIENIRTFDDRLYQEAVSRMRNDMGYADDEQSSRRVVEYICENIK